MSNIYQSVQNSLFAVCKTFITDMANAYPANPLITVYNFDAFSQQNSLPSGDLVGLHSYSIDIDSELATTNCKVCLSTDNDRNLFRLNDLTGLLLKRLLPDTPVIVYDSETDSPLGQMKILNGTSVSPILQAVQRPLKMIAISAALGLAVQS